MKGTGRSEVIRVGKMIRDKMPVSLRAKQFMPFRAVTGLEEALRLKEEEISELYRPEYAREGEDGNYYIDERNDERDQVGYV